MSTQEEMKVSVLSPQGVVYEGMALSLSSKNSEGPFDIFPSHARFMTLLRDVSVEVFLLDGSTKEIPVTEAVLVFQDAVASVYVHHPGVIS